jgi:hypothetical protein
MMAAKFASHGLKVTFADDEDVALSVVNVDPDRAEKRFDPMLVSKHFFERVAYEFLSLGWFVKEISRRADASTLPDTKGNAFKGASEVLTSTSSLRQALLQLTQSDQKGGS